MADHCGFVVEIKELRKHSNADRLQVATIFGNSVIVDMNTHVGDTGVYFPVDMQLSEEFCRVNDLVRRKDENGNIAGGYLDPGKRNIRAMKLRGEISDGLYLPITCLAEFTKVSDLVIGDTIDVVNGHEICRKYIPRTNKINLNKQNDFTKKKRQENIAPTFFPHVETEQLAYHLDDFKNGDVIQLTLKMHGSSGRTGYLPLLQQQNLWDKILHRHRQTYGYITGSRRVVFDDGIRGGFYEQSDFRKLAAAQFEGKLRKGETVYYEIVGYTAKNGVPIMASGAVPKENQKQYGSTMEFSYGCDRTVNYCDVYVYRMTMVNEEGDTVEYSPAEIRHRCEQIGVKAVFEFETFVIPYGVNPGEFVLREVEKYYDGPDPIGKIHVREGVVVRNLSRDSFVVYKHKNYLFKAISGIIVNSVSETANISEDILEEM